MQSALFGQQKVRPFEQVTRWEPVGQERAAAVGVVSTETAPTVEAAKIAMTKSFLRMNVPPLVSRNVEIRGFYTRAGLAPAG